MASFLDQLRVMLWRNYLLKKRGWKRTLLELLLPLVLIIIVVLVSMAVGTDRLPAIDTFPTHNLSRPEFAVHKTKPVIAGPEQENKVQDIMERVISLINVTGNGRHFQLYANVSSEKIDDMFGAEPNFAEAAVQFLVRDDDDPTSSKSVVYGYELRLPWDKVKYVTEGCSYKDDMGQCNEASGLSSSCPGNQALTSGLLSLQYAVETALIQTLVDPRFKPPALQVQMMPVHTVRPGTTRLQYIVSITMVITLAPLAYFLARTFTAEKEGRHRMTMRIMGLRDSVFWLSWLLVSLVTVVVVSGVACVVVLLGGMFHRVGLVLFFLLMLLYGASLITLGFLTAVFFNKAKIAGGVSGAVTMLSSLLYLSVSLTRSTSVIRPGTPLTGSAVPFAGQLILSLCSPVAFALGLDHAIFLDEEGLTSSSARVTSGQFPLLASLLMLLFDTALYGLLAAYLDSVIPNKHRVARRPWFCFTPSFWRGRNSEAEDIEAVPTDTPQGPHIEPIPEGFENKVSVRIRDLTKQFPQGKDGTVCVVNGLDLDVCEGQITCLLGHSGSGKSTLINMLTGIIAPTSGCAFVYRTNVANTSGPDQICGKVGYCPQQDVFSQDLTVQEHMEICGRLIGMAKDDLENEISKVLKDLGLHKKRHQRAKHLNGVQRRKLSLAMALLGKSKVLLLDEPSSGLDPESRRQLWGVLQDQKQDRVILVTTHHMDEADILADRKAVLSKGRLRCVGSSAFLKQKFGVGYQLHVTLGPTGNTDRVLRAIKSQVRGANLVSCDDNERTFSIPSQHSWKLSALFKKLESSERGAEYLGIKSYSIFFTSLEQVFLKLDEKEFKPAEEEEAGNVFISPLLTPAADDVFDEEREDTVTDDVTMRRLNVHLPRPATSTALDQLTRRLTMLQLPLQPQEGNNDKDRRKSAFPKLQNRAAMYARSNSDEEKNAGKSSKLTRRISSFFSQNRDARPASAPFDLSLDNGGDAQAKNKKDRAKSFQMIGRSKTAAVFQNLSEIHENKDQAESEASFSGIVMPMSLAARRATVAAYKDFRRSVSVQGNMSTLGDTAPSDEPLAKILLRDSFEQSGSPGSTGSSISGFPSVPSATSLNDAQTQPAPNGTRNTAMPSSDIRKVFADLRPMEEGWKLEWYRFKAMLKFRLLIKCRRKRSLLLRMLLPVVLTLLGIGLFYASMSSIEGGEEFRTRVRLDNIYSLLYKNSSGRNVNSLLDGFSQVMQMIGGRSRVEDFGPGPTEDINSTSGLTSVLDILSRDGDKYKLLYNYTCGTALTQLTSLILQAARVSTPNTTSTSDLGLALQTEAWLRPWPDVDQSVATVVHNWVPMLFIGWALAITPTLFAVAIVDERKKRIRDLLHVSGVGRLMYWDSSLVADVFEFMIGAIMLAILGAVSQMEIFEEEGAILALFLLVILYVPVSIMWVYVLSLIFKHPNTCRFVLPAFVAVISASVFCAVHFLDRGGTTTGAQILHIIATVCFPPYISFGAMHYMERVKTVYGVDHFSTDLDIPTRVFFQFEYNIAICFLTLLVYLLVLPFVLLLLDTYCSGVRSVPCCNDTKNDYKHIGGNQSGDNSVVAEKQRVKNIGSGGVPWPMLLVEGLSKLFRRTGTRVVAVRDANFAVAGGEVVGLLGPSGAGKTTALDMMVGLCKASLGTVSVDSEEVSPAGRSSSSKVGYCLQQNALWNCLTVDEHMDLFGALRGLESADVDTVRDSLFRDLDLNTQRDEKTLMLSEGEKRKLSFALSVLGKQSVVLLDEPSAGMDPRVRRIFWNVMGSVLRADNRCAVMTTHCVDEAETVCSRVAVMVNGEMRCLGSPEELRKLYDNAYTLEVKLRPAEQTTIKRHMDMLRMFLGELFPDITVVEQFRNRVVFKVKAAQSGFSLASAFETLDALKRNLELEDYTFSRSSMEQVYIDFARHQKEGESRYCLVSKKGDTDSDDSERNQPSDAIPLTSVLGAKDLKRNSDLKGLTPESKRHTHTGDAASGEGDFNGADAAASAPLKSPSAANVHRPRSSPSEVQIGQRRSGDSLNGRSYNGSAAAPLESNSAAVQIEGVDNPGYREDDEENKVIVQTSL